MKQNSKLAFLLFSMIIVQFVFIEAKSQCNIIIQNLPDTILACKNTTVQLNPNAFTTAGTPYYVDTIWTPGVGLSDSTIINPIVSVGTTSQQYSLTVQAVLPFNLIPNGDFSLGDTIFSSDYVYGTGGSFGLLSFESQYAIATNANNTHVNFASFGDHTTGTGQMMVINGSNIANVNIWCQTINVNPNTYYDFSAWGATCVASNPAILQFSINGVLSGSPLALPLATGVWTQFHTTWYSDTNTTITICITDQATALSGNDFAIDDIAFKEICNATDSVYIQVVNLTPAIQIGKQFGCDEDTIHFVAQDGAGHIPFSYLWSFGDATYSNVKDTTHIYTTQGVYNIKLITELSGCKDSVLTTVNTLHPIDAVFLAVDSTGQDTVCLGGKILGTSTSQPNPGLLGHSWNWGDGTPLDVGPTVNHVYSAPGTYTITLIITDTLGCQDSAKQLAYVISPSSVSFTMSDSLLCVGEAVFFTDSISDNTTNFTWDFGDEQIVKNIHNPTHSWTNHNSVSYKVTLTGESPRCPNSEFFKYITVEQYPWVNLGPDTIICPGLTGTIVLTDITNTAQPPFVWSTGETSNTISITQPGLYWLQVSSDSAACLTTDSIWVKRDCYLNIPNSFSPNGDGLNDYFLPRELLSSGLSSFTMNIYNRWGENIFTTNKIDGRGWDGKYNSENQPVGVYVYIIEARFVNNVRKEFKGNVTLLR
jgi:gliding motility-associated-like protein